MSRKALFITLGTIIFLLMLISVSASKDTVKFGSQEQAVLPAPSITPFVVTSIPSPTPKHSGELVRVVDVIDGDTVKVETGDTIRYIGIDTPETVHPNKPVMCYGKEASDKNTELVEGKIVELEKDISETDKYGRQLRYIWLDDVLVNELLVKEGYAHSSSYPPDVKYQSRFVEAQQLARKEQKGLWGSVCNAPVSKPMVVKPVQGALKPNSVTTMPEGGAQAGEGNRSFTCNCSKTCAQMSSCAEAQYQLDICNCSKRDADGDGIACDSDCQ